MESIGKHATERIFSDVVVTVTGGRGEMTQFDAVFAKGVKNLFLVKKSSLLYLFESAG